MDVFVPSRHGHRVPAKAAGSASLVAGRDDTRWWLVVSAGGVLSGLVGVAMTLLLHLVQHAAFGHSEETFLFGVEHATAIRRVLVLAIAGLVAGIGWWLLRRASTVHTVGGAVGDKHEPLPVRSTTIDGCLQVVVVGMGASMGREGAPRQVAAALGGWLAQRCGLDVEQRRS